MELFHTEKECNEYSTLQIAIYNLQKIQTKLGYDSLQELINNYQNRVDTELEKYNSYIGKIATVPPAMFSDSKERRTGKIKGNFYFNQGTVRYDFNYGTGRYHTGFDTHDIRQMIEQ